MRTKVSRSWPPAGHAGAEADRSGYERVRSLRRPLPLPRRLAARQGGSRAHPRGARGPPRRRRPGALPSAPPRSPRPACRCERRVAPVIDSKGVEHRFVEQGHRRLLETVFGEVTVTRLAYRVKDGENLHLADAALNLPAERHSHGLRALAAIEASRGSYEEAQGAIERATGTEVGKRQVEELARRAAVDVDAFYYKAEHEPAEKHDALVLSADGKGIVMRPDALRPATRKAAKAAKHKLKTRLTRGEK
ncbi:MAG: UPF0236 family transposase-like protein [Acidimicrobiales bacterium]